MSPQIIKEKVEKIFDYLDVLQKYKDISYQEFLKDAHFTIERIL